MTSKSISVKDFYAVGGTMPVRTPSYVERTCDRELFELTQNGELAYVLSPRQTGKRSLMVKTAQRLEDEEGLLPAIVDFNGLGSPRDLDQFCREVAQAVAEELQSEIDVRQLWASLPGRTAVRRLERFYLRLLEERPGQRFVIFLDEIENSLLFDFPADDFWAALRAWWNAGQRDEDRKRLSFVLIGVASPDDMIVDARRTPFNVGTAVHLGDFELEEARRLADGVTVGASDREEILQAIYHWTGGHPYLTHKLFRSAALRVAADGTAESWYVLAEGLVDELFLSAAARHREHNLSSIRKRIDYLDPVARGRLLKLYVKVLGDKSVRHEPLSEVQTRLILTGLVVVDPEEQALRPRNRIYAKGFDQDWAAGEIERLPRQAWRTGALGAAALLCMLVATWWLVSWSALADLQRSIDILEQRPIGDPLDVSEPREAYGRLTSLPFKDRQAREQMAGFWRLAADQAEEAWDTEASLIYRMKSLTYVDDAATRREAARDAKRFDHLLATFHAESGASTAGDSTPRPVLAVSSDLRQWVEAGESGRDGVLWTLGFGGNSTSVSEAALDSVRLGPVTAADFSGDGQILFLGTADGRVALWQRNLAETGSEEVLQWPGHTELVDAVAVSHEAGLLASVDQTGVLRVWPRRDDGSFTRYIQTGRPVIAMASSPDGRWLATVRGAGPDDPQTQVELLYVSDGEVVSSFALPSVTGQPVRSVVFSADSKRLMTGSYSVRSWDLSGGRGPIGPTLLGSHSEPVIALDVGALDLAWVISAGGPPENLVRLWHTELGFQNLVLQAFPESPAEVASLAFDGVGSRIGVGMANGSFRVWRSSREVEELESLRVFHEIRDLEMSSTGDKLYFGDDRGQVKLWRFGRGAVEAEEIGALGGAVTLLDQDPRDRWLLAAKQGLVRLWRMNDRLPTQQKLDLPHQEDSIVGAVAFDDAGTLLATAAEAIRIWDLDGPTMPGFPALLAPRLLLPPDPPGETVHELGFDGSGRWLALLDLNGKLRMLDVRQALGGPTPRIWPLETAGPVMRYRFDQRGEHLLTSTVDGVLELWRLQLGLAPEPVRTIEWRPSDDLQETLLVLRFAPDGERFFIGSSEGYLGEFRLDGQPIAKPALHWPSGRREAILHIDWSPSGDQLMVATAHRIYGCVRSEEKKRHFSFPYAVWSDTFGLFEDRVVVAFLGQSSKSLTVRELGFEVEPLADIYSPSRPVEKQAAPEELLRDWQRRLGRYLEGQSTRLEIRNKASD